MTLTSTFDGGTGSGVAPTVDAARRRPPAPEVADAIDPSLRSRIRAEGVDPQRDSDLVRRIAHELVRQYDERSLTGAVAPVGDVAAVVEELVARVAGFGPLQRHLDDPEVEEIWINDPRCVR